MQPRLWIVALSMSLSISVQAADYPPQNHAGGNLTLANNDRIWGAHTNIGSLSIPAGVTVKVRPFDPAVSGSGGVDVSATNITIAGTLDATGAGHEGGGGGGGGGGCAVQGFFGNASKGFGGFGGQAPSDGANGNNGTDGTANSTNDWGGPGGTGGAGGGLYSGSGGTSGICLPVQSGGSGGPGSNGGYKGFAANGDTSTDKSVEIGSGGGGGGGGAGGGTNNMTADQGAGGGGSGAAGGNGGGSIKLQAQTSLVVTGTILARGIKGTGGTSGLWGVSSIIGSLGGDGASGAAPTSLEGTGNGGAGGGGTFFNGGNGGADGKGAGGGISLSCAAPGGLTMTNAMLDSRGGADATTNGGTVKIFYGAASPASGATIHAGRTYIFDENPDNQAPTYPGVAGISAALSVAGQPHQVLVQWNAATDNVFAPGQIIYEIYASTIEANVFSGAPVATATGVTETVVTGLPTNGAQSYIGVRAKDPAGNREMNTITLLGPALTDVETRVWQSYE